MRNLNFKIFASAALLLGTYTAADAKSWYVSPKGSDTNSGNIEAPYRTISKAALHALAGDSVIINGGTYREWVSPANSGMSPARRITYVAAAGEKVYLKGSEVVTDWKRVSGDVWSVSVPNSLFGGFNPFAINLTGDWLSRGKDRHLGEVYIDGVALAEVTNVKDIKTIEQMRWYSKVGNDNTIIYANFGDATPTKALTEINVRPTCFFPKTNGVNFITVDGLNISQAATQWSPPTGEQVGIIGPNWSKEWIIKNCDISYSKCVGVCLGKERSTGHNMWSQYYNRYGYSKSGFNREIEAIISAVDKGWSKENIGSHLVENNKIYECGQAGIVGHLGCAFSTIRHNEIYNANYTDYVTGAETGGIKLHASIDVIIEDNLIYNTRRAVWLDWQAQGTQVRNNIFAKSIEHDFFIEVSHGPTMVYNNIMLSETSLLIDAQGVLFANNLFNGRCHVRRSADRYTPYHVPHSTKLRGLFNNTGGDVRFYNNLFLANAKETGGKLGDNGLSKYNRYPSKIDNSKETKGIETGPALTFNFPVYTHGNVYYKNGSPYDKESNHTIMSDQDPDAELEMHKDGSYYLKSNIDFEALESVNSTPVNTDMLGHTFISEAIFENRDCTPFILDSDFYGDKRESRKPLPGPFESKNERAIWVK